MKGFEDRGETAPFLFILNIIVPGTPVVGSVMYWALDRKQEVAAEANATEKTRANDVFVKMLERCVCVFVRLFVRLFVCVFVCV